jgi:hypothetical protein
MPPGWMTTVGSTREDGWRRRWVRRNLGRERVAGEGRGARMSPILIHFHCGGSSPEGSLHLAYSGAGKEDGLPPKHDFRRAEAHGRRSQPRAASSAGHCAPFHRDGPAISAPKRRLPRHPRRAAGACGTNGGTRTP